MIPVKPFECSKCHAMVFTLAHIHAMLCNEYVSNPALVANTHLFYAQNRSFLATQLEGKAHKTTKGRVRKYKT